MSLQVIDKYKNNIFSTDFTYNYIQPNKYNISYKTYIHPQLIYIYNFLKHKIPNDCIIKIIKFYVETSSLNKNKFSINSYSLYKYNLKKYMDNLFDKTIKIILDNYINSKKKYNKKLS